MESGLGKFVNNKYLADVSIKFEDLTYKAHKVVLAGASEYYFRLFENDSKSEFALPPITEAKFSKVPLKSIFESILKYIYSDQDFEMISESLNEETVNTYLSAGYSLGIASLTEFACEFIIDHILSAENCIDYLGEGLKFYSTLLVESATTAVLNNFSDLFAVPKNLDLLVNLPYKVILDLLANDSLKVDNERIVYDFVGIYIAPTKEIQRKPLTEEEKLELLSKVRWPFLSHSDLLEAAANAKISISKDLVLEGLSVQLAEHNKPKDYIYKVNKTPRNSYQTILTSRSIPQKNKNKKKPLESPIRFFSKSENNWKTSKPYITEKSNLRAPQEFSKISKRGEKDLSYTHDFDENGAFYYLASNGLQRSWENPHIIGSLKMFASSISAGKVEDLCGRTISNFKTKNEANAYIGVDLGLARSLKISAYSLRNGNSSSHTMLNWQFEASNNEEEWIVIDKRVHSSSEDVKYLSEKGKSSTWGVAGVDRAYRYYRLVMLDKNLAGNHILSISCMELYGKISGC